MTPPESRSHLAHSWAVAIIIYWAIVAAGLIIGPLIGWTPVLSLAGVDDWLTMTVGVLIMSGAVMILASLGRYRYRSTRWTMELIGLISAGGGWFAFGWAATTVFPFGLSGWAQGAAFTAACMLRGREVIINERRTRRNVEHLEGNS